MALREIVRQQYQRMVDGAVRNPVPKTPPEGWLRTVRKSLGMSGAQLARKMGVTRARVAQAENAELDGGITLKSMQATAEAMGCQFVYAIVPPHSVHDLITAQARKKAANLVGTASKHMALESQVLPNEKIVQEVERLTQDLVREMRPDFWSDQ